MITTMLAYKSLFRGNNYKGANTLKAYVDNESWANEIVTVPEALANIFGKDITGRNEIRLLPGVFLTGKYTVGLGLSNYLKTLNSDFDTTGQIARCKTFAEILQDPALEAELLAFPYIFEILFSEDMFEMAVENEELSKLLLMWLKSRPNSVGILLANYAQLIPQTTAQAMVATDQAMINVIRSWQTFEQLLSNTVRGQWDVIASNDRFFGLMTSPYILHELCKRTSGSPQFLFQVTDANTVPNEQAPLTTPTPNFRGHTNFNRLLRICMEHPQLFKAMPVSQSSATDQYHNLANDTWSTTRVNQNAIYFWRRAQSLIASGTAIQINHSIRSQTENIRIAWRNNVAVNIGFDVNRVGLGTPHLSNAATEAAWTTDPNNPQGIAFLAL